MRTFVILTGRVVISLAVTILPAAMINAHEPGPRGLQALDWHIDQISRANALLPFFIPGKTGTESIEGKHCVARGLEYRILQQSFEIEANKETPLEI